MKRVLTVAAILAIAIPAFASSELTVGRVTGVNHAAYNLANGKLAPMSGERAITFTSVWDVIGNTGYYFGSMAADRYVIDWGDLGDPNDPTIVAQFAFAYAVPTTLALPNTVDCDLIFFGDYNGFNNNGFYPTFGFGFTNLPTANGTANGWVITLPLLDDLDPNYDLTFPIVGNDLDGDAMADFGYGYWFPDREGQALAIGPFMAQPLYVGNPYGTLAAAEAALGTEDAFDSWLPSGASLDPIDPNTFIYEATYWFGGWDPNVPGPNDAGFDPNVYNPYSQWYLQLWTAGGGCPNPGASGNNCTADLDGDCVIGLGDLGALLPNYGMTGTGLVGDYDNSGDVGLSDLGLLLGQYGDDCN